MDTSTMLDKVVGHYTVVGTEEATEFLRLCDQLGLKWHSGLGVYDRKELTTGLKYICVYDDGDNTLSQENSTRDLDGVPLRPFTLSTTPVGVIDVPFGAEYYVSFDGEYVVTWFKKSDGVILECMAPKTSSTPQYPFWEVSTYPTVRVLGDSFGSSIYAIHELGVEGKDWVEMGR